MSFAGVPQTGATNLSTYTCMAPIRASSSTPSATVALLKQAIVGSSPRLNAPKIGPADITQLSFLSYGMWSVGCGLRVRASAGRSDRNYPPAADYGQEYRARSISGSGFVGQGQRSIFFIF